jgi:probable HAF family extracellular repeat protein
MRVLIIALAAAAVTLLATAAGSARSSSGSGVASPRWVVTDLGNLGRARVTVADINDRGRVVGEGSRTRHGAPRGFVWQNGSMRALGHGPFAGAQAINERGQIIGTSSSSSTAGFHAVLWEKGRMLDLGPADSAVTDMNERGQILGTRSIPLRDGYTKPTPVVWTKGRTRDVLPGGGASAINDRGEVVGSTKDGRAALWRNGRVTDLGPGHAVDINDAGVVVGLRNDYGHVFVWRDGRSVELPPNTSTYFGAGAVAINERGQVIGVVHVRTGEYHPFVWKNRTMTDLGTLGGGWTVPTAISDRGQVVGYGVDRSGHQYAFVWQNGTMTRLPSLKPGARTRAIAINDRNQIIGDDCPSDCVEWRGSPSAQSKFGVIWTLRRTVTARRTTTLATTVSAHKLPAPLGAGEQKLSAGVQVLDLVAREQRHGGPAHVPRIAITLPSGWFNYNGWAVNDGSRLQIGFWDVKQVYATPCRWKSKPMLDPGRTVDGLASALAGRPLRHASTPTDVTLAGFHGKYLKWSVPSNVDFATCDQGYFESWTGLGWSRDRWQQAPGQVDRLWILNVNGVRLVVDAAYLRQATRKDRAELDRVVHSIRFLHAARRTASASAATEEGSVVAWGRNRGNSA